MSYTTDESPRFVVSGRSLNVLAALVWCLGGIVLLLKGRSLLVEADVLKPEEDWAWFAAVVGVMLGGLQARYVFAERCRENLDRIAALDRPRVWQFFSPRFFVALLVMILAGAVLSRVAYSHYWMLLGVGILDLGVGIALLGSSYVYWKRKAFAKR